MTEDKNYTNVPREEEEFEIDLMEYVRKLWDARLLLIKVAGIAAIVGVIIAFTTPKEYTVNVTLAPESSKTGGSGLSGIASMLGVGGMNVSSDADALHVTLYPDIVSSTPFILDLLDTPVSTINEEEADTTLAGYLKEYTKTPLISTIISLPFKAVNGIISLFKSESDIVNEKIDPFRLTKAQAKTVGGIRKLVIANVDKKTGVTTISVTMQDPLVAAILTDTVVVKLKEHITKYRVSKAEENCLYWEQLNEQRKSEYYQRQKDYAEYVDANKNIVLQSVLIERERLQNEMNLALQVYTNVATQLQMAKAKVQEAKPVFAIVEPASVPLLPSGTSRKMILIVVVFMAVAGASAWILFGKDLWGNLKKALKEPTEGKE